MMETLQGFETWFFGGLISLLLGMLIYFAKNAWDEMKQFMKETRVDVADLRQVQAVHSQKFEHSDMRIENVEQITKQGQESFEKIMTKLGAMGSRK